MAIRKPSGVPVSIVLSYLEMEKTFAMIQNTSKLDDYFRKPDVRKITALLQVSRIFNCILIDLICQQFVNERGGIFLRRKSQFQS